MSWGAVLTTRQGRLAAAIVLVELIGGMQVYLTQTIIPLVATDLHGRSLYGVITATGLVATFAGLPIGAHLTERMRIPPCCSQAPSPSVGWAWALRSST